MAVPVTLSCWHLEELLLHPQMFGWVSVWGLGGEAGVRGQSYFSSFLCGQTGSVSHGLESCRGLGEPCFQGNEVALPATVL